MDSDRAIRPSVSAVRRAAAPFALLAAFVALALPSAVGDAATFDETAHLPAGLSYLERGDFRHNAEHPPLAKAWAALPIVLLGRSTADYDSPAWRGAHVPPGDPRRSRANQWTFGFETINGPLGDGERRDPARLLVPARAMMIALGVVLGLVLFGWSRDLWGTEGATLTLAVYALSPTMLAHTRLVTTDLPAALGFAATGWAATRWARRPSWQGGAVVGVVFGLGLLCKFSVLLAPVLLAPALVLLARRSASTRGRIVVSVLLAAALSWAVVWAGYGFRWSAVADSGYRLEWESMEAQADEAAGVRLALALRDARLVPEAYAFGLAYLAGGAGRRLGFLNGETSIVGWWWYFPEAFAIKTPLATLALLAAALAALLRRSRLRRRSVELVLLGVPALGYLAVSMAAHLNLGHRHLLPVYPFLFVGIGGLARLRTTRFRRGALVAACVALAVSTVSAAPSFLAYFNALAGGPREGWRYLVDSNVDWGQDLARLPARLAAHGIDGVDLAYFGTADPEAYGLRYRKVAMVHDFRPEDPEVLPGPGDVLAISVTLLQGVYLDADREFAVAAARAGAVRRPDVEAWLALRDDRSRVSEDVPPLAEWLERTGRIAPAERVRIEAGLRSTRIRTIRDDLEPFDRVGGSILLFRLPQNGTMSRTGDDNDG